MAYIHLVRHGTAPFMWGSNIDPGLTDIGREEAQQLEADFADTGPLPIVSSPMARARQTAGVLSGLWNVPILIHSSVSEVPPSPNVDEVGRRAWVRQAERLTWSEMDKPYQKWRDGVLDWVLKVESTALSSRTRF